MGQRLRSFYNSFKSKKADTNQNEPGSHARIAHIWWVERRGKKVLRIEAKAIQRYSGKGFRTQNLNMGRLPDCQPASLATRAVATPAGPRNLYLRATRADRPLTTHGLASPRSFENSRPHLDTQARALLPNCLIRPPAGSAAATSSRRSAPCGAGTSRRT